jgi:hypothetical protein
MQRQCRKLPQRHLFILCTPVSRNDLAILPGVVGGKEIRGDGARGLHARPYTYKRQGFIHTSDEVTVPPDLLSCPIHSPPVSIIQDGLSRVRGTLGHRQ